ncbi:multiple inositol polyphosphate phosphatase 1-like [Aricia agestis]|uniref:multiple inositol polyphosphate phosphatase 1-like n=1 Tax=Aricia agestis TaxID=91739 RepID=UPI001C209736|nr:multiple inositol polyphosphate phosphatase 1-like [Aricia agestis]
MWLVWMSLISLVAGECYWRSKSHYLFYGNKTPYDIVRGDIREVPPLEGCSPASIWFMVRHGTRFPDKRDRHALRETSRMKYQIIQSHLQGNGSMCEEDIEVLRSWSWDKKLVDLTSFLTLEGYKELMYFGMRFGERFSEFLDSLDDYSVQATKEQRTAMSARAFLRGVRKNKLWDIKLKRVKDDMIIRPYRHCKKRAMEALRSKKMMHEIEKFTLSEEFQMMTQRVRHRTGLLHLTEDDVIDLYNLCRYLRSFEPDKTNPWCAIFRDKDLEVLEYVEDIRHYYVNGYGTSMNPILGASGLKNMYEKFAIAHNGTNTLSAYFSHGAMVDMMYTALGMFQWPISGLNRDVNRVWRKSFMTPFGGTLIAILQRCDVGQDKVQFFTNEKEIFPCGKHICTWKEFEKKFEQYLDNVIDFC